MWSKAPRQTCFDTVSQGPGPGAYNPKDVKKTAPAAVAFGKQTERFKREDSSLSTGSTSTASSARSAPQMRPKKLEERLRTFEVQIRERDQIISRLKMDKLAALSRYQVLVDAYKQLRRVSGQSIPSQKLPKDISHEIMKILQEERQQSKEESRPSMSEKEIKDQMATFIVEMEETEDPRIQALEGEKAALEMALDETKKRVELLQEENENLKAELGERAFEIGQLSGSLRASEDQLQRANALVDSMNSNASTSTDKLFATLKELGEAKAIQASLENTVAQQTKKLEEIEAKHDRTMGNLQNQLESKVSEVRELEQKLTQLAASLRSSQDERERLAGELSTTLENLERIVDENGSLAMRSLSVEEELGELKRKCKQRKGDLSVAEERISQEKNRCEELNHQLTRSRIELEELRTTIRRLEVEAASEKQVLQNQLQQSQENFERQLEEARRTHGTLEGQKDEIENELKLALNRMSTLEDQVQERDELLAESQLDKEMLHNKYSEVEAQNARLHGLVAGAEAEGAKAEEVLRAHVIKEEEMLKDITKLKTQLADMELLNDAKDAEIKGLQLEIAGLTERNSEIQESLERALNETATEQEKLRALEKETSSIRLLHLATTAELEQSKTALENASRDSTQVDALKLKLATVEAEKARLAVLVKSLEEQVESWLRVRDSLSKQLAENEEKYQDSQEAHMSLMKVRENNIKILEEHLDSVKKAHEDELNSLRRNFEQDKEKLSQTSTEHLREIQEKSSTEIGKLKELMQIQKTEFSAAIEKLKGENELLKSETESLIDAKASFSLQLQARESEVLHLRSKAAEADFYENKCHELEKQSTRLRENLAILHEDIQVSRQELVETQQTLEHAKKANEAHAMFTWAVINSGVGKGKADALQLENDNLRHQLSSLNDLLDTLETGIETSEAKNSVYVKSYAQMQQQVERLVGHNNNKQRIQYVGKLQTENRELKEEQAKLRTKIDAMQKKMSQLEHQLRSHKDKENKPEATNAMSTTHSRFY